MLALDVECTATLTSSQGGLGMWYVSFSSPVMPTSFPGLFHLTAPAPAVRWKSLGTRLQLCQHLDQIQTPYHSSSESSKVRPGAISYCCNAGMPLLSVNKVTEPFDKSLANKPPGSDYRRTRRLNVQVQNMSPGGRRTLSESDSS